MSTKQLSVRGVRVAMQCEFQTLESRRLMAVHVWTGASDSNWSNPANWTGGAPAVGEADVRLEFPAGATRSTAINDVGNLAVTELRIGQGGYQLQGQAFTLNGTISAALEQGSHRIGNNIVLGGDSRIETTGASSTDGLALIFNGVISGSGSVTKYGHNVRFTADNTYTGDTILEGGGISINGQQPQSDIVVQSGEVSGFGRVGAITFGQQFGSLGTPVQPSIGLAFDGLPILNGGLVLTSGTYFRPVLGTPGGTQIVNGAVTLGNANLSATYTTLPAVGETFVLLSNDGVDAVNGTFAGLAEGATFRVLDKDLTITYAGGDGNDVAVTVVGTEINTRTQLTPSAEVVEPGQSVTLSVSVVASSTPGVTPGGTVKFFKDGVLLAERPLDGQGRASLEVTSLPLRGSAAFSAVYGGDPAGAVLGSRSEDARVRVVLAGQTETQVFLSPASGFAGESSLIIARVVGLGIPAGTPTGTVEFFVGDRKLASVALDAEGRAQHPTSMFPIGLSTVRVVYSGDAQFTTSTGVNSRVTRLIQGRYYPTTTTLAVSTRRSHQGQPMTLTATVRRVPGLFDAPYGGTVSFFDGSTLLGTAAVNPAGQAVLVVEGLEVGPHALGARFNGSTAYFTSVGGPLAHTVDAGPSIQPLTSATAALSVVADVDRDGDADLIWRDAATGANTMQILGAGGAVERTVDLPDVADPRWKLEAAGVFNGQGLTDLVWRNEQTGRLMLWRVNGEKLLGTATIETRPLPAGWRVAGTGDIDRDGQDDIIWRNELTGQALVWLMKLNSVRSVEGFGPVARNLNWRLDSVADVNGDDRPDLLWVNQRTNRAAVWLMKGTQFAGFRVLGAVPGAGWKVAGVADVDQDESQDVLFRNTTSGAVQTWALDVVS